MKNSLEIVQFACVHISESISDIVQFACVNIVQFACVNTPESV